MMGHLCSCAGALAFCISPLADNLTTALIMGATVMAVGGDNELFVVLSCINIVVAANAGGAFSPFGDITTLMVWTSNKVQPMSESADELDVLISVTCRLPMLSSKFSFLPSDVLLAPAGAGLAVHEAAAAFPGQLALASTIPVTKNPRGEKTAYSSCVRKWRSSAPLHLVAASRCFMASADTGADRLSVADATGARPFC